MFDYGIANDEQIKAISTVKGPLLITAGPGTGKTYTLVQRAVYLIQECDDVAPEQIFIATFTEKAAKELVTRITDELSKRNIKVNLNEMYIGTFHSICLRILKENLAFTRIKKNYRLLDKFDQQYIIFQNFYKFRNLPGFDLIFQSENGKKKGQWQLSGEICKFVNTLSEEMVDFVEMQKDKNNKISAIGRLLERYERFLSENNYLDFSSIQVETYCLLFNYPEILGKLQDKIKYIMVDEYQDTNYIQEQLVFLLGSRLQNICVVGDDDQGLYRFRGATIRNILEFAHKFPEEKCKVIPLKKNYRSNSDIVDFYNLWMKTTSGENFRFSWDKFRLDKTISAHEESTLHSPAVIRVSSEYEENEDWFNAILGFIKDLKNSGKLRDYNQIAFLFRSVKNNTVVALANFLEEHEIKVYSPRSDMFFSRPEIKQAIGCLLLTFPKFALNIDKPDEHKYFDKYLSAYFTDCIEYAISFITNNPQFQKWIRERGLSHSNLLKNTDYAFSGLFYQMLEFPPFKEYLDTDLSQGAFDLRPQRNLSIFTQILQKYEFLHNVDIFQSKNVDKVIDSFFNLYLKVLFKGGITEYEDDSEYAPSGCVSFLTIHQAKGMEFPIVFTGIYSSNPRSSESSIMSEIEIKYFHRKLFEPIGDIKYFDFWRLYYTAFSRAQNLLILTTKEADGRGRQPSAYFRELYEELPRYPDSSFDLQEFTFADVKDVNLKETYSFTSHVLLYERCSLQYKFFKELGFTPSRIGPTIFGTIVHQTIEDVHRAALRGESNLITPENIEIWFSMNYDSISRRDHAYLGQRQLEAALGQVQRYVDRQTAVHHGDWSYIRDAEVDVGLVEENYILEGTIDLIRSEGDKVDIIDFKSEKKPDIHEEHERIELYRKQLQIYAYLVEERKHATVDKMHIYYTGTEDGNPMISFSKDKVSIQETVDEFGEIVGKIQRKEFCTKTDSAKLCQNCDMRHYCGA